MRESTRPEARVPRASIALVAALLVALSGGLVGGVPVRAAQSPAAISYSAVAEPNAIHLCTGTKKKITVKIVREILSPAGAFYRNISGGAVFGASNNNQVAKFPDFGQQSSVVGRPEPKATLEVIAVGPGETDIDIDIVRTGDEASHGSGWPEAPDVVHVEVSDCYLAHTSGLASIFTTNEMADLDQPFVLLGHTPNTHNLTTVTQMMFFIPDRQDRNRGVYAFVDTATAVLPGITGSCTSSVSGNYKVVFYIPPGQPEPPGADVGDLQLSGSGSQVCGRFAYTISWPNDGMRISFKPKRP